MNTKTVHWPLDQPQPATPLRGDVCELTFDLYVEARWGEVPAAVQQLFDTHGPYRIKPKRNSRGVIWRNRAFWWSRKGYYRPGDKDGPRRPLQHLIWEAHHGRVMPREHEIFFRDRDRHNWKC